MAVTVLFQALLCLGCYTLVRTISVSQGSDSGCLELPDRSASLTGGTSMLA